MARRFTRSILLPAMAAFSLSLMGPHPLARASLPRQESVDVYVGEIPSDGAIRGTASMLEGSYPVLTVFFLSGEEVSGELVWSDAVFESSFSSDPDEPAPNIVTANFTFFPDEPLGPGQYIVRAGDLEVGTLTVVEATGELPLLAEATLRELPAPGGNSVQCAIYAEGVDTSVLFTESTVLVPALELDIEGLYANQYNYVIQIDGERPQLLTGPLIYPQLFEASAAILEGEVCFEVYAIPLRGSGGGSLAPRTCLSTAGLDLGTTEELYGGGEQPLPKLGRCLVPPLGYEAEWCDQFAEAFTRESCDNYDYRAFESCMSARETCEAGDLFGLPQANDAERCSENAARGGCALSPVPSRSRSNAWYFAGLSLLFAGFGVRRWRSWPRG